MLMMGFVGDLLVNRDDPESAFSRVRDLINTPDILFGNLESAYTDKPVPAPSAPVILTAPEHNLNAYSAVGFDVLSLANNHILDVGYEAMMNTRARLREQGIATCGVGSCLSEAHDPAFVTAGGIRVAFLAYSSVFPMGYEARFDRAGLAPVRAYNLWRDALPNYHAPGMLPVESTVPDESDLAYLANDIARARDQADLVITSFHWGDYTRPYHLTDHERRVARFSIDHGADLVVGHHHHVIRGMEWYKGKPIMYGLGHFVWDSPRVNYSQEELERVLAARDPTGYFARAHYYIAPREGWPLLPMHEDTRMTVMAWATASRDRVREIGFVPCMLTADGLVHPLSRGCAGRDEVIRYFKACNRTQGLRGTLMEGSISISGISALQVVPD